MLSEGQNKSHIQEENIARKKTILTRMSHVSNGFRTDIYKNTRPEFTHMTS